MSNNEALIEAAELEERAQNLKVGFDKSEQESFLVSLSQYQTNLGIIHMWENNNYTSDDSDVYAEEVKRYFRVSMGIKKERVKILNELDVLIEKFS